MKKLNYVCPNCMEGDASIARRSHWNFEMQRWDISDAQLLECTQCGHEGDIADFECEVIT